VYSEYARLVLLLLLLLQWLQHQQSEAYAVALIPITAATAVTLTAMMPPLFKCVHTLVAAALDRADASSPDLRLIKKQHSVCELELRITPKCTVQLVYKSWTLSWTLSLTKPAGWSAGTSLFSVHWRRLPEAAC